MYKLFCFTLQIYIRISATTSIYEKIDALRSNIFELTAANVSSCDHSKFLHMVLSFKYNRTNTDAIDIFLKKLKHFIKENLYCNVLSSEYGICKERTIFTIYDKLFHMHDLNYSRVSGESAKINYKEIKNFTINKSDQEYEYKKKNNNEKKSPQKQRFYFICNYFESKNAIQFVQNLMVPFLFQKNSTQFLDHIIVSCEFPDKDSRNVYLDLQAFTYIHDACEYFNLICVDTNNSNIHIDSKELEKYQKSNQDKGLIAKFPKFLGLSTVDLISFEYSTFYGFFNFEETELAKKNISQIYEHKLNNVFYYINFGYGVNIFEITVEFLNKNTYYDKNANEPPYIGIKFNKQFEIILSYRNLFFDAYKFEKTLGTDNQRPMIQYILDKRSSNYIDTLFSFINYIYINPFLFSKADISILPRLINFGMFDFTDSLYNHELINACNLKNLHQKIINILDQTNKIFSNVNYTQIEFELNNPFLEVDMETDLLDLIYLSKYIELKTSFIAGDYKSIRRNFLNDVLFLVRVEINHKVFSYYIKFSFWGNILSNFNFEQAKFKKASIFSSNSKKPVDFFKNAVIDFESKHAKSLENDVIRFILLQFKNCKKFKYSLCFMASPRLYERFVEFFFVLYYIVDSNCIRLRSDMDNASFIKENIIGKLWTNSFTTLAKIEDDIETYRSFAMINNVLVPCYDAILSEMKPLCTYAFDRLLSEHGDVSIDLNISIQHVTPFKSDEEFDNFVKTRLVNINKSS
ncbi:hypothetical protein COBT_000820 [Conglomerata obtusa]